MARLTLGALLLTVPMGAWCQPPSISIVVDSASYAPTLGSPDAIVTIFGANLASATATAQGTPLPRELAGTRVTWNGVAAPILYVSPAQINLQVPSPSDETPGVLAAGGVVVSTAAGNSALYTAPASAWYAAGLFSADSSGCGRGAVLNVAADGSTSVNSAANSAQPGSWISVFGTGITGLRDVDYPADAQPSPPPAGSLANGVAGLVLFDLQGRVGGVAPQFFGFAPGLVGVSQVNAQIPSTVREGCAVPVQLFYSGSSEAVSQPVTIAIRKGGGACLDPPRAGYGQIIWQKTISQIPGGAGNGNIQSESDAVMVSLQSSPGMTAPPIQAYTEGVGLPSPTTLSGPACPVPGYRSLDAGTVKLEGAGLPLTQIPATSFSQGQLAGLSAYQATLPNGTIQAGSYTVTGTGGADVAGFEAMAQIGADIEIQTPLAGATLGANCKPITIQWTGGDATSWVTARLIQHVGAAYGGYQFVNFSMQARAADGTLTVPLVQGASCATGPANPIVVSVEVDPDPSEVGKFTASGLSLGGQVTWRYVHTFQAGLVIP